MIGANLEKGALYIDTVGKYTTDNNIDSNIYSAAVVVFIDSDYYKSGSCKYKFFVIDNGMTLHLIDSEVEYFIEPI